MKRRFLLPALATLLAAAACGPPAHTDPAKVIHAQVGAPFTISLPSNHSTGYDWYQVDSAAAAPLELVDSEFRISRANRRTDGGGGDQRWTFRPSRAGQAVVTLVHVPPSQPMDDSTGARFHPTAVGDTTRFRVIIE